METASPSRLLSWNRLASTAAALVGVYAVVLCLPLIGAPPLPPIAADSSLDVALGNNGRERLAATLRKRQYFGKTYAWEQYAGWGQQLVTRGFVKDPPVGQVPSERLSEHYRCVHCHNLAREEDKLTVQDPAARERRIRADAPEKPERRDGSFASLTPGTTLWGAVNRDRYYNGFYQRYHSLRVSDGNAMNPEKLADAVETCCRYCSGGRFPETWELDAILAFLWDRELRLKDLGLPEEKLNKLIEQLNGGGMKAVEEARKALRQSYLRHAAADQADPPQRSEGNKDLYADGTVVTGDAAAGKLTYSLACAGCHGDLHPLAGRDLLRTDARYHKFVFRGTERDGLYMPFFSSQRLSRQQTADIRAHLRTLK